MWNKSIRFRRTHSAIIDNPLQHYSLTAVIKYTLFSQEFNTITENISECLLLKQLYYLSI
jgi:hypothetical protein